MPLFLLNTYNCQCLELQTDHPDVNSSEPHRNMCFFQEQNVWIPFKARLLNPAPLYLHKFSMHEKSFQWPPQVLTPTLKVLTTKQIPCYWISSVSRWEKKNTRWESRLNQREGRLLVITTSCERARAPTMLIKLHKYFTNIKWNAMYSCQETGKWPELPDSCSCCNFVQFTNWHTESEAQDYWDLRDGWEQSTGKRSTSVNFRAVKVAETYTGSKRPLKANFSPEIFSHLSSKLLQKTKYGVADHLQDLHRQEFPQVQHNIDGICENGSLRNEGEFLMLTVSQISKAVLVLLNILEGKKWL